MSMNSMEDLHTRYRAGDQLSSREADSLLQWLHENPDARQEMLLDESIDNQLHCMARINDEDSVDKFVSKSVERAFASQPSENVPIIIQTHERNKSHSTQWLSVFAGVCVAALVFVGISVAWYAMQGQQPHDFGFAQIANSQNLSWELVDGASRRIKVSSGNGEVRFDNGTIAQLQAPVVVELRSAGSLYVDTGFIKMNVPPAAVGFTVETPLARIVDFGTKFDVDVGESGQTETRLVSGIVTFEPQSMGITRGAPIKLTADGLNRASARESTLAGEVRSIVTEATGPRGQFFGKIHVDGKSLDFGTRRELDDFRNRLTFASEKSPSQFRGQSKVTGQTSTEDDGARTGDRAGDGIRQGSPGGRAQEMLIEQLRSMQRMHPENTQMQELLDGMMLQVEEGQGDRPETSQ